MPVLWPGTVPQNLLIAFKTAQALYAQDTSHLTNKENRLAELCMHIHKHKRPAFFTKTKLAPWLIESIRHQTWDAKPEKRRKYDHLLERGGYIGARMQHNAPGLHTPATEEMLLAQLVRAYW